MIPSNPGGLGFGVREGVPCKLLPVTAHVDAAYFALLLEHFHRAPITQLVRQTMTIPRGGEVEITLHPDRRQHHGAGRLHGGILGLLLDNAGFFAAATASDGFWVATVEMKLNLLDSVGDEAVLARGRVLRRGRHMIHTEMRARSAGGLELAAALGTYTVMPRKWSAIG